MMNAFVKTIFLGFGVLISGISYGATCTVNANGEVTDTTACTTDTDLRIMTIYEIGLCLSEPTGPTTTSAFQPTSSCTKIFDNSVGSRVGIRSSGSTALNGSAPLDINTGNYSWMYLFMDPRAGINTNVTFSSARSTDSSSSGNTARETGTKCWTKSGDKYNWYPNAWSVTPTNIVCGNTISGQDTAWTLQNSLDASSGVYYQAVSTAGGTYKIHLTKTDKTRATTSSATSMGDVAKVLVLAPVSTSITDDTRTIDLSFKVLDGTNVDQITNSGTTYLYDLAGSGNIVIQVTTSD